MVYGQWSTEQWNYLLLWKRCSTITAVIEEHTVWKLNREATRKKKKPLWWAVSTSPCTHDKTYTNIKNFFGLVNLYLFVVWWNVHDFYKTDKDVSLLEVRTASTIQLKGRESSLRKMLCNLGLMWRKNETNRQISLKTITSERNMYAAYIKKMYFLSPHMSENSWNYGTNWGLCWPLFKYE